MILCENRVGKEFMFYGEVTRKKEAQKILEFFKDAFNKKSSVSMKGNYIFVFGGINEKTQKWCFDLFQIYTPLKICKAIMTNNARMIREEEDNEDLKVFQNLRSHFTIVIDKKLYVIPKKLELSKNGEKKSNFFFFLDVSYLFSEKVHETEQEELEFVMKLKKVEKIERNWEKITFTFTSNEKCEEDEIETLSKNSEKFKVWGVTKNFDTSEQKFLQIFCQDFILLKLDLTSKTLRKTKIQVPYNVRKIFFPSSASLANQKSVNVFFYKIILIHPNYFFLICKVNEDKKILLFDENSGTLNFFHFFSENDIEKLDISFQKKFKKKIIYKLIDTELENFLSKKRREGREAQPNKNSEKNVISTSTVEEDAETVEESEEFIFLEFFERIFNEFPLFQIKKREEEEKKRRNKQKKKRSSSFLNYFFGFGSKKPAKKKSSKKVSQNSSNVDIVRRQEEINEKYEKIMKKTMRKRSISFLKTSESSPTQRKRSISLVPNQDVAPHSPHRAVKLVEIDETSGEKKNPKKEKMIGSLVYFLPEFLTYFRDAFRSQNIDYNFKEDFSFITNHLILSDVDKDFFKREFSKGRKKYRLKSVEKKKFLYVLLKLDKPINIYNTLSTVPKYSLLTKEYRECFVMFLQEILNSFLGSLGGGFEFEKISNEKIRHFRVFKKVLFFIKPIFINKNPIGVISSILNFFLFSKLGKMFIKSSINFDHFVNQKKIIETELSEKIYCFSPSTDGFFQKNRRNEIKRRKDFILRKFKTLFVIKNLPMLKDIEAQIKIETEKIFFFNKKKFAQIFLMEKIFKDFQQPEKKTLLSKKEISGLLKYFKINLIILQKRFFLDLLNDKKIQGKIYEIMDVAVPILKLLWDNLEVSNLINLFIRITNNIIKISVENGRLRNKKKVGERVRRDLWEKKMRKLWEESAGVFYGIVWKIIKRDEMKMGLFKETVEWLRALRKKMRKNSLMVSNVFFFSIDEKEREKKLYEEIKKILKE